MHVLVAQGWRMSCPYPLTSAASGLRADTGARMRWALAMHMPMPHTPTETERAKSLSINVALRWGVVLPSRNRRSDFGRGSGLVC